MGSIYSHYKDMERQMFENAHNQTMSQITQQMSTLPTAMEEASHALHDLGSTAVQGIGDLAKDFFLR